MKRSEIRGNRRRFDHAPGLHFVPSGLRKNERKTKSRKRNADRRNWYSAVAYGDGRAWIARRTPIGVTPRCSSQGVFHRKGTQPQARLPGTRRDTFCVSFERALPALAACPSPAKAPRAPIVVPERWCPKPPERGLQARPRGHTRPCDPGMPSRPRSTERGSNRRNCMSDYRQ